MNRSIIISTKPTERCLLAASPWPRLEQHLSNWDLVLFLDFGGHSMSLFKLERLSEVVSFIEVGADGTGGGGEMWSCDISELIVKKLRDQGIKDVGQRRQHALTQQFSKEKGRIDLNTPKPINGSTSLYFMEDDLTDTTVHLTVAEITDCLNRGMESPINMARRMLEELAAYTEASIGVVVSGGSLKAKHANDSVFQDCPIPEDRRKYTEDIEHRWESPMNFQGAALAVTNDRTPAKFFQDGAAIGNKPHRFDCESSSRRARMKLVCDPHYGQRDQQEDAFGRKILIAKNRYDLFYLDKLKAQGDHIFEVMSDPDLGGISVCVTRTLTNKNNPDGASTMSKKYLPLYFDAAHNCIHVDVDKMGEGTYDEQERERMECDIAGADESEKEKEED
ncbi:hypothetical protein B0T17DRAFT_654002 [Bombardia bombarda]|uniref:Uncharacterized protein n=1 Tax=Bombardia bombarda TaxID=252184 RepID=A0AA40C9Z5_9PEZI|nr:hypothetical protein B0T17DRAFT_654002 [Bombardia bombarda]